MTVESNLGQRQFSRRAFIATTTIAAGAALTACGRTATTAEPLQTQ